MSGDNEQGCVSQAASSAARFSAVGLLVSVYRNAVNQHSAGAFGVFTRSGGDIGYFAAVGAVFAGATCATKAIREKDDFWNAAVGGCLAGATAGARSRNFQSMCFGCFLGGASMGIYQFSGGSLKGLYNPHDSDAQYYRRKEFLQSDAEREEKEKSKQAAKEATQLYN